MTGDASNEKDKLFLNAMTFQHEAREVPEQYYEATLSGPEADREMVELAHLGEIACALARRDKP